MEDSYLGMLNEDPYSEYNTTVHKLTIQLHHQGQIVDELNAKYNHNRNVEKCKRRMKYLVDKYKERKDWNRKQSGGSLWKSPHYDEIDEILGVRDVVTFTNVAAAGSESSSPPNTTSQERQEESSSGTPSSGTPSPVPADASSSSADSEKEKRRVRKKRKNPQAPEEENETGKVMKTVTDQGERIANVMEQMQEAQTKQMDMMTKFMGAMLEILNKNN
ncbi:hypothetical protein ACROYT_G028051 [Oculina patagonica]